MSTRYNSAAVQAAYRQWEGTPGSYQPDDAVAPTTLSAILRTDWDEVGAERRRVQRTYATLIGVYDVEDFEIGEAITFGDDMYTILNRDGDAFGQVRLTIGRM